MDILARSASACALLISAFSLLISWRNYHRDRSDLRISLYYQFLPGKRSSFDLRVTNHGRRVAYVETIYLFFRSGAKLFDSVAGGKKVNEGQPYDYWFTIYEGNESIGYKLIGEDLPVGVKGAEIYDTLGNRYKYPYSIKSRLEFRKLKVKIQTEWVEFCKLNPE